MRFTSYIDPYVLALLTFSTICITYTQLPSTKDELNIRNKLALYAYAVDNKDYGLLEQVFTADVKAIYGDTEEGELDGVCRTPLLSLSHDQLHTKAQDRGRFACLVHQTHVYIIAKLVQSFTDHIPRLGITKPPCP